MVLLPRPGSTLFNFLINPKKEYYWMNMELEIKFMLNKDVQNKLVKILKNNKKIEFLEEEVLSLHNRYFDTSESSLYKHGIALRIRNTNGKAQMTIKTKDQGHGGLFIHPEYNVSLVEELELPELSKFPAEIFKDLDLAQVQKDLSQTMAQYCDRTAYLVKYKAATIELSYDKVTYKGASEDVKKGELELELKEGELRDLVEFAKMLITKLPDESIYLGTLSKMQQAAFYANLMPAPALIEYDDLDISMDEAFKATERNELNFLLTGSKKAIELYIASSLLFTKKVDTPKHIPFGMEQMTLLNKLPHNLLLSPEDLAKLLSNKDYLLARVDYVFNR